MRTLNKTNQYDRQLLVYLFIVMVVGMLALISASAPAGFSKFADSYFFVRRQFLYGFLPGCLLLIFLARGDYHWFERHAYFCYALTILLLVLVYVPGVGAVLNGSRSWISISFINIQPSEFAKMGVIILTAYLISKRKESWDNWQVSLLPVLTILSPALFLVLIEPDVGTLCILAFIICALLFLAGLPFRFLGILAGAAAAGLFILIMVAPYRLERITTFLHPELDPRGVGYHINQAFLAVGSGGFWGLGYGNSLQKYQYLPETSADSIFAIFAEENGFIISSALILLIVLISWRGFKIAKNAPDDFSKYLVYGITIWFLWQSTLNIGAMVGVLPLTGVPLPMVSHGGSAYLAIVIGWALVLSVSRQCNLAKA